MCNIVSPSVNLPPLRRKSYTFLHVVRFNPTNMQQSVRLSERKAKGRPVDTERP